MIIVGQIKHSAIYQASENPNFLRISPQIINVLEQFRTFIVHFFVASFHLSCHFQVIFSIAPVSLFIYHNITFPHCHQ